MSASRVRVMWRDPLHSADEVWSWPKDDPADGAGLVRLSVQGAGSSAMNMIHAEA